MSAARREATQQEAKALANPIRLRILRLLRFDQLTNAEIAAELDMQPATTLHHVRTLQRAGFITLDAERPGPNGITEKQYRDTQKSWALNVTDSNVAQRLGTAALDSFVAEIAEAGGKLQHSARQALNLNDASLRELTARLTEVLDGFEGRDDPDGRPYATFIAIHRRPKSRKAK